MKKNRSISPEMIIICPVSSHTDMILIYIFYCID